MTDTDVAAVEDDWKSQSPSTDLISAALRKAQGEMPNAVLNCINPHYRSRYADFASLRTASKATLDKYGIAVIQGTDGKWITMRLELEGKNQWYQSRWPALQNSAPQATGSHFTYFRRYLYSLMLALAAEEEDDAEVAEASKPIGTKQKTAAQLKQPEGYPAVERAIRACQSVEELKRYSYEVGRIIADWREQDKRYVREEYDRRMTELEEGVTEEGKPVGGKLLAALKKSIDEEDRKNGG